MSNEQAEASAYPVTPSIDGETGPKESIKRRTLGSLAKGERAVVRSLEGGRTFRSRAANLGFTAGAEVTVIQNYGRGPIIVALRGTRVALGRSEAAQIYLEDNNDVLS